MARRRFPDSLSVLAAVGAAASVLGLTAIAARKPAAAPSTPKPVALIGDSYALGLGPELAKLLPNFQFMGQVGISTGGWLNCDTCAAWLEALHPTLVLVSLGVNDGSAPVAANYQAVVRALHGIGARVVWIEPPAAVHADAVRAVIRSLGVPVIRGVDVPMAPDQLHPASYASWAKSIAEFVGARGGS